jgi:hypothetical protein
LWWNVSRFSRIRSTLSGNVSIFYRKRSRLRGNVSRFYTLHSYQTMKRFLNF